ncbi:MAG: RNA-binding domain-containing protein [Methanosarcinaceae archaeon]|nr:RNA-binding domain-containing protein [Methanosarcinaceae archaeon]
MIHIEVSASVYPTEDPEKVSRAISRMFEGIEINISEVSGVSEISEVFETSEVSETAGPAGSGQGTGPVFRLTGEGGIELLNTLHRIFREESIIDSVRKKAFNKGLSMDGRSVRFLLDKQVAFVGFASFPPEEKPLDSIEVHITAGSFPEMERLSEWLLPLTEDGKPIIEVGMDYVEGV